MAKYCASCNTRCENDEAKFCTSCGSAQFIPEEQPLPEQATVMPQLNNNFAKEPKKKSGVKKLVFGIIALCLVIAIALNFSSIFGKLKQTFGSAKSYYADVEKKSMSDFCDTFEEYYEHYLFDNLLNDSNHNIKTDIKLSDELLSTLTEDAGDSLKLDWMKNLSLDITVNSADSALSTDLVLGIDKQNVLTAVLYSDAKSNEFLLKLKDISNKVLKFDTEKTSLKSLDEFDRETLKKVLPKSTVIKTLITKYHAVIVENIENVEKTKEDVKLDDISEKLTVLTCTLTEKDIKNISLEIIKELKSDKDIKAIFNNIQNAVGGEDTYASFIEGLDEATKELNGEESGDETVVTIRDYVNSKGEIVGRKIGENGEYLDYLCVESGNKYSEFFKAENGISFKETGTKKGDRVTGECVFEKDGESLYKISFKDFDKESFKKGKLDGKIRVTPNSSVVKEATPKKYKKYAGILDMAFDIDIKGNYEKGNFKFTLLNGENPIIEADATYSVSAGKAANKPDGKVIKIKGLESLYGYVSDMHLDGLIDNLRKTSIPKDYIKALEEISSQLKSQN